MFYQNFLKKLIKTFIIIFLSHLFVVSSFAAGGGGDDNKQMNVKSNYYYKAVKLINKNSYQAAIDNLLKAEKTNKKDADIYNYLGFSYRKIGNLKKASQYYNKALEISPKHKGALEYQGEMFLTQGNLEKAEANLKKLKKICYLGCKEEKMLKESIMKYNKGQKSSY
jgi:tetratricopeptide (TPR) repeat protein